METKIDEKCYLYGSCKCQTAGCVVRPDNGCPVYRYFKNLIINDYENRLKTDMVAMLTEIQIEFDEKYWRDTQGYIIRRNGFNSGIEICIDIIQQKINKLKEAD